MVTGTVKKLHQEREAIERRSLIKPHLHNLSGSRVDRIVQAEFLSDRYPRNRHELAREWRKQVELARPVSDPTRKVRQPVS